MQETPKGYNPNAQPGTKGNRTGVSIRILEQVPMPKESFELWGYAQRTAIAKHRYIYKIRLIVTKDQELSSRMPTILSTDKNIGEWMCSQFAPGNYIIMGYANGKTKTHKKLVALCKVQILDELEKKYKITKTIKGRNRLSRMWYYKGTTERQG